MIKTNHGKTELKGAYPEILADYSVITCSIFKCLTEKLGMDEDEAKDKLNHAYDGGFNGVDGNSIIGMLKELIKLIEDGKADVDIEIKESEDEK